MMKNKEDKTIYQTNPNRQSRWMHNKMRHDKWQPEHERLNVMPVTKNNAMNDFMYRRNVPNIKNISKNVGPVSPNLGHQQAQQQQAQQQQVQHQQQQARLKQNPGTLTGMNYEHVWTDAPQAEFEYSNVPDPPATPFANEQSKAEPQSQQYAQTPVEQVSEGEYCVFISGALMFSTPSLEDVEDALNRLIFSDKPVSSENVVVMKRLKLKIGASVE